MPMFRDCVPKAVRPWIYVLLAFCFQFSGGVYLGAMNDMIGEYSWMREDLTMLQYCNLAGMAAWFPVLFRMKFHFTNKALLLTAAVTILCCNALTMMRLPLPVMAVLCVICGAAKIQGTFECMSIIQLWMTPKRDFAVFFPLLHIILLTAIEGTGWLAAAFAFYSHWTMMHYFVMCLMLFVISVQVLLCRPFCPMPPERRVPLNGIDWTGGLLWIVFWLEVAWVLTYGDWLDWFHSRLIVIVTAMAFLTLAANMIRMRIYPTPFIEWRILRYRYLRPILFFVAAFEVILSVEHVLEKVYYEEVMHYTDLTAETLNLWSLAGAIPGCLFSLLWLKVMRWSQYRLIALGMASIGIYCVGLYFLVSPDVAFSQLIPPLVFRGFGYALLCITFMWCLHEIMSFEHFFQALCIFNFLHMFGGGSIGAAILAKGIGYYVADGFARYNGYIDLVTFTRHIFDLGGYMEGMVEGLLAQTVKILYGWMTWVCLFYVLGFLLWDSPGVRHRIKRMPSWSTVGARTLNSFNRSQKRLRVRVKRIARR